MKYPILLLICMALVSCSQAVRVSYDWGNSVEIDPSVPPEGRHTGKGTDLFSKHKKLHERVVREALNADGNYRLLTPDGAEPWSAQASLIRELSESV